MKKRFTVIFSRIFLIITFLSIFTFQKQANAAASKIYYLSRYDINLVVNSDGSADFEERLTYNFQGQFNEFLET